MYTVTWKQAFEGTADVSEQCDVAVGVEKSTVKSWGYSPIIVSMTGIWFQDVKSHYRLSSPLCWSSVALRAWALGAAGAVLWGGGSADYRDEAMKRNQSTIILLSESAFRSLDNLPACLPAYFISTYFISVRFNIYNVCLMFVSLHR